MFKNILTIITLFFTIVSYSQSKEIIGSWLTRDSVNTISFLIKEDGTIEKRTGANDEPIMKKTPETGTYVFKKNNLVITWADKSIGFGKVKFIDKYTIEIEFTSIKDKAKITYIFKRLMDEEVKPDK